MPDFGLWDEVKRACAAQWEDGDDMEIELEPLEPTEPESEIGLSTLEGNRWELPAMRNELENSEDEELDFTVDLEIVEKYFDSEKRDSRRYFVATLFLGELRDEYALDGAASENDKRAKLYGSLNYDNAYEPSARLVVVDNWLAIRNETSLELSESSFYERCSDLIGRLVDSSVYYYQAYRDFYKESEE